jgi:hypothetical protein
MQKLMFLVKKLNINAKKISILIPIQDPVADPVIDKEALNEAEIRYFIDGLTKGTLPEYQMSALAMAICF